MACPRFPAPDLCRFLERDERTAMYSRILKHRVTTFEAVQKDASGTVQGTERAFPVDLRPDFRWPQLEVAGKERDERRRSIGTEGGEDQILGGSDPTFSGFAAPPRPRPPGSLPPKSSSRAPRPLPGSADRTAPTGR